MKTYKWLVKWLLIVSTPFAAHADQLLVLSAAAVKTSVAQVPEVFAAGSEDRVRFQFGTSGAMRDTAIDGVPFEVVIVPPAVMTELAARDLVDVSTQQPLGVVRLGAAVAKGQSPIDLTDIAALKRALTQARSVGIADPARGATSGIYLSKLFANLGLGEEMKSKLKLYAEGQNAMEAVARHEIEIAMGQFSEASSVAGLEPLVPLPEGVQLKTIYVAAIGKHAPHPIAARRLLELLSSPSVQQSFMKNGFDEVAKP